MILRTDRLIIRPTTKNDIDAIHEILNDEETMTFFVEGTYSKEKVKEIVNRNNKAPRHFTVSLKTSNRVIGKLSFNDWFMKDTYEIGWIFSKTATGNGYCTEAAKEMLKHAFTELKAHRVIATCQPENTASNKVCEKLGMRKEAFFKQSIHFKDDIWWDEYHYGILKDEFTLN
jgi:RimJ/RimL family protein N-acetyltransferase